MFENRRNKDLIVIQKFRFEINISLIKTVFMMSRNLKLFFIRN